MDKLDFLPNDIKKYCVVTVIKKVILCLLMFTILLVIIVLWGDVLFPIDDKYIGVKRLCYLVVLSLPFIVTKISVVLFDFTFVGVVKTVDIRTRFDSTNRVQPSRFNTFSINTIYLNIETNSKKWIRRQVYSGEANEKYFGNYNEDDTVLHLRGTKHIVVLPKPNSTHCTCAVCGSVNEIGNTVCYKCKHTLVKSLDD